MYLALLCLQGLYEALLFAESGGDDNLNDNEKRNP